MKPLALLASLAILAPPIGAQPGPGIPIRLSLAAQGNQARFIVREQLAGAELPNDAVGVTSAITGGITLGPRGLVDSSGSRISVDLTTLSSDRARRDNFIKRRTIVTDSFPTAELVVTEIRGLPAALPASGTMTLVLSGNLTIHGVTRPSAWDVVARVEGESIVGKAVTRIKFGDFGMTQPRVAVVLSVVDDIRLEYDFHFVREPSPGTR